jgi:hypothetical protein
VSHRRLILRRHFTHPGNRGDDREIVGRLVQFFVGAAASQERPWSPLPDLTSRRVVMRERSPRRRRQRGQAERPGSPTDDSGGKGVQRLPADNLVPVCHEPGQVNANPTGRGRSTRPSRSRRGRS